MQKTITLKGTKHEANMTLGALSRAAKQMGCKSEEDLFATGVSGILATIYYSIKVCNDNFKPTLDEFMDGFGLSDTTEIANAFTTLSGETSGATEGNG